MNFAMVNAWQIFLVSFSDYFSKVLRRICLGNIRKGQKRNKKINPEQNTIPSQPQVLQLILLRGYKTKSLYFTWQPRRPPASPSPPCPPPPGRGRRTGRASPPTANTNMLWQFIKQCGLPGKTWVFRFTMATCSNHQNLEISRLCCRV